MIEAFVHWAQAITITQSSESHHADEVVYLTDSISFVRTVCKQSIDRCVPYL